MKQLKRNSTKVKPGKYYTSFACETITGGILHARVFSVNKEATFKELKEDIIKTIGKYQLKRAIEDNDIAFMLAFSLDQDLFRGGVLDIKCWEFDTENEASSFRESEEKRIETANKNKLN